MKKVKKARRKRSFSLFLAVAAVGLCVSSAAFLVNQQIDINRLTQEKNAMTQKLNLQQEDNNALDAIIANGNQDEYTERVAREKYGYVKQGEKVFYDIS